MTQDFMKRFCYKDKLRPQLAHIAPFQDYYAATDLKRLLLVKQSECDFTATYDEATYGKYPNIAPLIPSVSRYPYRITLADLKAFIATVPTVDEIVQTEVPTEFEECEACNGEGVFEFDETAYFRRHHYDVYAELDCPVCHGYGKVPKDPDYDPGDCCCEDDVKGWITYQNKPSGRKIISPNALVTICDRHYRATYIADLIDVMEQLHVRRADVIINANSAILFRMPTAIFLIMGVLVDDDNRHRIVSTPVPVTATPTLRTFAYRHRPSWLYF